MVFTKGQIFAPKLLPAGYFWMAYKVFKRVMVCNGTPAMWSSITTAFNSTVRIWCYISFGLLPLHTCGRLYTVHYCEQTRIIETTYFNLKELSCSFTVIRCNDRCVDLHKAFILQQQAWICSVQKWQRRKWKCVFKKRNEWSVYPEIGVNGGSGLTADPEQGTEGVGSAPQVRKLSDVLLGMTLLDLEGKVLQKKLQALVCHSGEVSYKQCTEAHHDLFYLYVTMYTVQ